MKNMRIGSLAAIAGSALLCLGVPAFGQTDVTIDFTGVENTSVQALGAYGGYYSGTVNGVASEPGFICDDYNNEIFLPSESWQATAVSFSSLASMSTSALDTYTDFGGTIGLAGYAAIANLSAQMNGASVSLQEAISAAIWYIGAIGSSNPVSLSALDSVPGAQTLVTEMESMYGSFSPGSSDSQDIAELDSSTLWLYTPTGDDITPQGDPMPQEFIGSVAVVAAPEGGAALLYLLLAMAACCGAMFFGYRDGLGNRQAA